MGWDDMLDQPMVTIRVRIVAQTKGFVIFAVGRRRCWALADEVRITRSRTVASVHADLTMTAALARELGLKATADKRKESEPGKVESAVSDAELPDWDDLRGRAPDATGELSSEAFVRKIRGDWR